MHVSPRTMHHVDPHLSTVRHSTAIILPVAQHECMPDIRSLPDERAISHASWTLADAVCGGIGVSEVSWEFLCRWVEIGGNSGGVRPRGSSLTCLLAREGRGVAVGEFGRPDCGFGAKGYAVVICVVMCLGLWFCRLPWEG
jgi:hypothetical protein